MFTINSYHSSNRPLQKDSEYPLFIFNSDFGPKVLTKEIVMTNVNKNKYRPILHATQFFPLITHYRGLRLSRPSLMRMVL